jgi:uncharacterized Zn finger protein
MCKHVAAVLYGVGARLDEAPQLLFLLRGVDQNELIAAPPADLTLAGPQPEAAKILDDSDVAALFGIEMDAPPPAARAKPAPKAKPRPKAKPKPRAKKRAAAAR